MPQTPYFPVNMSLGTLATLTAASASGHTGTLINAGASGVQISVAITDITGTSPTLTLTIEGYDPVSGQYFTLLESAALTATGFTVLTVRPGVAATSNVSASAAVPNQFRVAYAIGGTTPAVTATISGCLLV